ncbi:ribosomal RNA large subunit methyltransferase H [Candidatus Peregrinibacteria bacterium CG10_big_fil_rev_8_21_14_0_10_36_19]|nr:MAG: ribosomal RNA large subunit methyltransferase H [Candidatus Peregrinibacteria bacterium CG10_big_fil_rev_8_21_14_0_10_36_19]
MLIKIIQIGKTKDDYLRSGESEFLKRLSAFCKIEVITLQDEERALNHIGESKFVLLDELGIQKTSVEFSDFLKTYKDYGETLIFVIGGAFGVSDSMKKKAAHMISLSKMTFTHQMIRIFLLEQLYRAMCILTGKDYHH